MPPRVCLIGGGVALWGAVCAMRRAGEAERAEAGDSGAERGEGSRESTGQRDSIADGTALRDIVGEEVAANLREFR